MSKLQHNLGVKMWVIPPDHLGRWRDGPASENLHENINDKSICSVMCEWWWVFSFYLKFWCEFLFLYFYSNQKFLDCFATCDLHLDMSWEVLWSGLNRSGPQCSLDSLGQRRFMDGRDDGLMCLAWPCGKDIYIYMATNHWFRGKTI